MSKQSVSATIELAIYFAIGIFIVSVICAALIDAVTEELPTPVEVIETPEPAPPEGEHSILVPIPDPNEPEVIE